MAKLKAFIQSKKRKLDTSGVVIDYEAFTAVDPISVPLPEFDFDDQKVGIIFGLTGIVEKR